MNIARGRRLSLLGTGVLTVGVLGGVVAPGAAHAQAGAASPGKLGTGCVAMEELVSSRQGFTPNLGQVLRLDPPAPQSTLTTSFSPAGAPDLDVPLDMAFLPGGDIVVTDTGWASGVNQVVQVNKSSGVRTVISGGTGGLGTGPALNIPRSVAVEASGDILVGDDNPSGFASRILRIDPATGNRTLLTGAARGSGPAFAPFGVYVTIAGGVIYAVDPTGEVMSVDAVTGDRTLVSGATRGTGSMLVDPVSIAPGPAGAVAVLDQNSAGGPGASSLVQVDLASGDRSVVSSNAQNPSDPAAELVTNVRDVIYHACEKTYYVLQTGYYTGTLLKVDSGGNRTLFTTFTGDDNYSLLLRPVPVGPVGSGGSGGSGGGGGGGN
jgi:hypothetical protein